MRIEENMVLHVVCVWFPCCVEGLDGGGHHVLPGDLIS